jgi:hypothetical protein
MCLITEKTCTQPKEKDANAIQPSRRAFQPFPHPRHATFHAPLIHPRLPMHVPPTPFHSPGTHAHNCSPTLIFHASQQQLPHPHHAFGHVSRENECPLTNEGVRHFTFTLSGSVRMGKFK